MLINTFYPPCNLHPVQKLSKAGFFINFYAIQTLFQVIST